MINPYREMASNPTPHTDVRGAAVLSMRASTRAGGRER